LRGRNGPVKSLETGTKMYTVGISSMGAPLAVFRGSLGTVFLAFPSAEATEWQLIVVETE